MHVVATTACWGLTMFCFETNDTHSLFVKIETSASARLAVSDRIVYCFRVRPAILSPNRDTVYSAGLT